MLASFYLLFSCVFLGLTSATERAKVSAEFACEKVLAEERANGGGWGGWEREKEREGGCL